MDMHEEPANDTAIRVVKNHRNAKRRKDIKEQYDFFRSADSGTDPDWSRKNNKKAGGKAHA